MFREPAADEVFTPSHPVANDMFASRRHEHLQDRVEAALNERGRQVVLYGPTGIGKTSLIQFLCRQRRIPHVRIECGAPFQDMIRAAVGELIGEQQIEEIRKSGTQTDIGLGFWNILTSKIASSHGSETKVAKVPRSPAGVLADAMSLYRHRVVFFDNFENLDSKPHHDESILEMAQLLKYFSDRSLEGTQEVKVVVAGIPSASEELISLDTASARRTAQIEVTKMAPEELDQILDRGAEMLGIDFDELTRYRIVRDSDGFPYYTHLLGLHCSRRLIEEWPRANRWVPGRRRNQRPTATLVDFEQSLDQVLADCDLQLRTTYQKAVETSGNVRTRKSILEAMALLPGPDATFQQIRESFLRLHPQYDSIGNLNFLSPAVKELTDVYRIVSVTGKAKSPRRVYRFTNPLMKGYVLLQIDRERRQQSDLLGYSDLAQRLEIERLKRREKEAGTD